MERWLPAVLRAIGPPLPAEYRRPCWARRPEAIAPCAARGKVCRPLGSTAPARRSSCLPWTSLPPRRTPARPVPPLTAAARRHALLLHDVHAKPAHPERIIGGGGDAKPPGDFGVPGPEGYVPPKPA